MAFESEHGKKSVSKLNSVIKTAVLFPVMLTQKDVFNRHVRCRYAAEWHWFMS